MFDWSNKEDVILALLRELLRERNKYRSAYNQSTFVIQDLFELLEKKHVAFNKQDFKDRYVLKESIYK